MLQQVLGNGFEYERQPVCYRNIRELDLLDNTDLEVNIVWRSLEMNLHNLFEVAQFPHRPNVGLTFAAYLFR